jgi:hypothetical protein
LTTNRTQIKDHANKSPRVLSLITGPPLRGQLRPCGTFHFKAPMHFGFYLMIAAFVLMGVEVGYALYQLASFVL